MTSFVSPSGRYYRWPQVLDYCRAHPGWHPLLRNAPARVVKQVNLRRNRALRTPDGHLEAQIMNAYVDDEGTPRGDVLLKWHPSQGEGKMPTPTTMVTARVAEQEHHG